LLLVHINGWLAILVASKTPKIQLEWHQIDWFLKMKLEQYKFFVASGEHLHGSQVVNIIHLTKLDSWTPVDRYVRVVLRLEQPIDINSIIINTDLIYDFRNPYSLIDNSSAKWWPNYFAYLFFQISNKTWRICIKSILNEWSISIFSQLIIELIKNKFQFYKAWILNSTYLSLTKKNCLQIKNE